MSKKLQFDFTNEAIVELDKLVKDTPATTRAEVLRKSLGLYKFMKNKAKEGYTVGLKKEGEDFVIVPMGLL